MTTRMQALSSQNDANRKASIIRAVAAEIQPGSPAPADVTIMIVALTVHRLLVEAAALDVVKESEGEG